MNNTNNFLIQHLDGVITDTHNYLASIMIRIDDALTLEDAKARAEQKQGKKGRLMQELGRWF